ncbi:TIR domain-containing protein [Vibrio cyclitrophicus]
MLNLPISKKVFIVHGHDDGARETTARFLERIGFEAVILHEQANRGRTVIEKVIANSDVGFAVVLLTPDDEGAVKGGTLEPRARQNVLLELGYFIGHLGRDKVCALKKGDVEIPSDFAGVVWENMDSNGGWKRSLAVELEAAGHAIDWNQVMRA